MVSGGNRVLWLAIAIALLALPACESEDPALMEEVDLRAILPDSLQAVDVQRLDPNAGPERQWLVLYRYDVTEKFSPIAGVVYRADRGGNNQPPVIYPYPLRVPGRDYLGTENVSAQMADVLSKRPGLELVVTNKNASNLVTEAAIFSWRDLFPDGRWREHNSNERFYECMGFFRASGEVIVTQDRVIVKELAGDRSQLARLYAYTPDENGSYLVDGVQLKIAEESRIGFAFGQTSAVLDSPYPEKVVLAFYNALGNPDVDLRSFLSTNGQTLLESDLPGYGCDPWSPNQVARATVHEIKYFTSVESQTENGEAQQSLVELQVRCKPKQEDTLTPYTQVGWFLIREAGKWKMDRIYRPTE